MQIFAEFGKMPQTLHFTIMYSVTQPLLASPSSSQILDNKARFPPERRLVQPDRPGAQLCRDHDGTQWPLLVLRCQVKQQGLFYPLLLKDHSHSLHA